MTPGFAKPRDELPWLPYPEKDRMFVINSHNFGGPDYNLIGDELLVLQGPTGLTDLSGNGNVASYNGGMGVVADTGAGGVSAFSFDGVNDYISLGTAVRTSMPVTFSVWVKPSGVAAGNAGSIVFVGRSDATNHYWLLRQNATNAEARSRAGGTGASSVIAGITTGWHHVVGEFASATSRTAYRDGVAATANTASRTPTSVNILTVGFGFGADTAYFTGLIDDIRIFNRVLTSGEIAQLGAQRG